MNVRLSAGASKFCATTQSYSGSAENDTIQDWQTVPHPCAECWRSPVPQTTDKQVFGPGRKDRSMLSANAVAADRQGKSAQSASGCSVNQERRQ